MIGFARDARFGRIWLPTVFDDASEQAGDSVEAVGDAVFGGERAPRSLTLSLPAYGSSREADPKAVGDRLRRQMRALVNNRLASIRGNYFQLSPDPDLNGWVVAGHADVTYDDGGVSFGSYKVSLGELYRVGQLRSHRLGARLSLADKRTGVVPIDFQGTIYTTDFSAQNALSISVLPVRAMDLMGSLGALRALPRKGLGGALIMVPGRPADDVITYEPAHFDRKFYSDDVMVYDRQGKVSGHELFHPYGQRSSIPANPFPNPYPRTGGAAWSTPVHQNFNGGAVLAPQNTGGPTHSSVNTQQAYMRATTTAASAFQGLWQYGAPGWTYKRGRTYRFSIRINLISGNSNLQLLAGHGAGGGDVTTFNVNPTNSWQPVYSIDWTPTADRSSDQVALGVRTLNAAISDFGVAHLAVMDITEIPAAQRPTYALYCDGEQPGCTWAGNPDVSASFYQASRVNLHYNPLYRDAYGIAAPANTTPVYSQSTYPRRPSQPYSMKLPPAGSNDSYAALYTFNLNDTATKQPAQDFRMQGQRMACSAWCYVDAPPGAALAMPAGATDRSLLWVDGVGSAEAPLTTLPRRQWVRVSLPIVYKTSGYQNLDLRVYNNLLGYDVYWTDAQLEFSLDGASTPEFSMGDSECMTPGNDEIHGYTVENDPEAFGWEAVYGGTQELTQDDVPVLENGLCRVRYLTAMHAFAVDTWSLTGGYTELGRVTAYREYPFASFAQYVGNTAFGDRVNATRLKASVVEWTPDRAVIRVVMGFSANAEPNRAEVYITLQRGWTGPRFEMYPSWDSPSIVIGCEFRFAPDPNTSNAQSVQVGGQANVNNVISSNETTWSAFSAAFSASGAALGEPWAYLTREDRARKSVVLVPARVNALAEGRDDTTAYPGLTSKAVAIRHAFGQAHAGYCSMQIGVNEWQGMLKASDFVNGTATLVAAGGTVNAQVVQDTQNNETNNTIRIPAASTPPSGRLAVWIRARVSGGTGVAHAHSGTHASGTISTLQPNFTNTTFGPWIYLGEMDHADSQDLIIPAWNATAGQTVQIDRILLIPLERRIIATGVLAGSQVVANDADLSGARDIGSASLYDARMEPVLLSRT